MSVILDSEQLFKVKLLNSINIDEDNKWYMIKSRHRFAPIDFICINMNNLRTFYIEHKKRTESICLYNTLFINAEKIEKITTYFNHHSIYVWSFGKEFYWVKHKEDFNNYPTSVIRDAVVVNIPIDECNNSYDELVSYIDSLSNGRC